MQTDYKKINSFEVAVVGMIAVGFLLVGILLFSALVPRQQASVLSSLELLDLHEQAASTLDNALFIMNIPNEFYEQFYIAFVELAAVPAESYELPVQIISDFSTIVSTTLNGLTDQVLIAYAAPDQTPTAYEGKVLGSVLDLPENTQSCSDRSNEAQAPDMYYEYSPPTLDQVKLMLSNFINQ